MTLWVPCAIVESPWRHKHVPFRIFPSLCSRSIKSHQWKHKLDYHGVVYTHIATGCGINAIGSGFRLVNPPFEVSQESRSGYSPSGILAPPLSGIYQTESESSASGSFALECFISRDYFCHCLHPFMLVGIYAANCMIWTMCNSILLVQISSI